MRLFAIGDLHLSGGDDKPMDVFGPQWDRHFEHIRDCWLAQVREEGLAVEAPHPRLVKHEVVDRRVGKTQEQLVRSG